jgi:chromate transporter
MIARGENEREMTERGSIWETFCVFLKLGCTSFGGPIAHLGYFRQEFVVRRRWLDEKAFVDLVALCQFLPGPASSQVGMVVGLHRSGWLGALCAWIGFTMPSALLMTGFAYGVTSLGNVEHAGWLAGLKLAAVAVVAQAVWAMASKFCTDKFTACIALAGAIVILVWPSGFAQLVVIGLGSFLGWLLFRGEADKSRKAHEGKLAVQISRSTGAILLIVFLALLALLPAFEAWTQNPALARFDSFYRAGSFVFGGGHVVLPLLQTAVVTPGWVSNDRFLAGYGFVQAVPGPLFTFSAYLGAVMKPAPNGWLGALWCLVAIFIPAALVVLGALPFWEKLRHRSDAQALLKGANAVVVGVLLAALYDPVWTSAVKGPIDFAIAAVAFALLVVWSWPPWLVVASSAFVGFLFLHGA